MPQLSVRPEGLEDLGSGGSRELLQELGLLKAGRGHCEQSPPCQGESGELAVLGMWGLIYEDDPPLLRGRLWRGG